MAPGLNLGGGAVGSAAERPAAWGAVYAMALSTFVLVASEFMPVSLLSPIASDLAITEGQAGQSISVCGVAALLTSLTVARLIGGIDRRRVLMVLVSLLIGGGALVAFAPNFAVLMAGRVLVGVAVGGFWSLSAAVAMRLVPAASVPKALAVINGGNAIAATVAAPLGSFLGGLIGWRGAFLCVVPLAVAAVAWLAFALPGLPAERRAAPGGMLALLRKPLVAVGFAGAALFFAGQFALFTYLRPFLEQVTHVGLAGVSAMLLLVGGMGFVGTVLIGRTIGERLHLTLAAIPAIMAVLAVCLALAGTSPGATAALLAIWGLLGTAAPVVWWTWVTRAAADNPEAGGGLMVAAAQVGITSGAVLGGTVYDALGPVPTFLGSGALLVLAALVAFASGWRPGRACRDGIAAGPPAVAEAR
ncbi:MAG: MFS transporter [Azospirillum brasilense]|nr:MAG: MFS transporter [Azospirillum brasilense]